MERSMSHNLESFSDPPEESPRNGAAMSADDKILKACPGCGNGLQLELLDVTLDDAEWMVLCRPCQWSASGETRQDAIDNWNHRVKG
jgi:hypothetical protein